jgi:hypothetical protein
MIYSVFLMISAADVNQPLMFLIPVRMRCFRFFLSFFLLSFVSLMAQCAHDIIPGHADMHVADAGIHIGNV